MPMSRWRESAKRARWSSRNMRAMLIIGFPVNGYCKSPRGVLQGKDSVLGLHGLTLQCKVTPVIELRDALSQISEIRSQMAQTQTFRGYRAAPAAFSSLVAIGAALAQRWWVAEPARDLSSYLVLWIG